MLRYRKIGLSTVMMRWTDCRVWVAVCILISSAIARHSGSNVEEPVKDSCAEQALIGNRQRPSLLQATALLESGSASALRSQQKARARMTAKHRAAAWAKQYASHGQTLGRTLSALKQSGELSSVELDALMRHFMDRQASPEDRCPARLRDAKSQMSRLHMRIHDLADQINTTELSIEATTRKLRETDEELQENDRWKKHELAKCQDRREEDRQMVDMLHHELEEMKYVANQRVVVNTSSQSASTASVAAGATATLLQAQLQRAGAIAFLQVGQFDGAMPGGSPGTRGVQEMVGRAMSAAEELQACLARFGPRSASAMSGGVASAASNVPEECLKEGKGLKVAFVQANLELSRLLNEYESLVASNACERATEDEHRERRQPLERKLDALAEKLEDQPSQLQELRPRLDDARTTEQQLREEVESLTNRCETLPSTTTDLDRVREAIRTLESSPGLSLLGPMGAGSVGDAGAPHAASMISLKLPMPTWTGSWATIDLNVAAKLGNDAEIDLEMRRICAAGPGGERSRPAEVSEIQEGLVEGAPHENSAPLPVLGACPQCAGDADPQDGPTHASGHARICWDPQARLDSASRRSDCATGEAVVMCVVDEEA